jgi:hypothetical protein
LHAAEHAAAAGGRGLQCEGLALAVAGLDHAALGDRARFQEALEALTLDAGVVDVDAGLLHREVEGRAIGVLAELRHDRGEHLVLGDARAHLREVTRAFAEAAGDGRVDRNLAVGARTQGRVDGDRGTQRARGGRLGGEGDLPLLLLEERDAARVLLGRCGSDGGIGSRIHRDVAEVVHAGQAGAVVTKHQVEIAGACRLQDRSEDAGAARGIGDHTLGLAAVAELGGHGSGVHCGEVGQTRQVGGEARLLADDERRELDEQLGLRAPEREHEAGARVLLVAMAVAVIAVRLGRVRLARAAEGEQAKEHADGVLHGRPPPAARSSSMRARRANRASSRPCSSSSTAPRKASSSSRMPSSPPR